MKRKIRRSLVGAAVVLASVALIGCGGGDAPPIIGGPIFTTAPSQVNLDSGAVVSYRLNGGNFPYAATSGNANVARVAVDGLNLNVTAISSGTAPITISDAAGGRLTFNVTVAAQGSSGTPLSLTPGALTVGNCTTRIPFIFNGGAAPFTVFTSDNFSVPVSSPLRLDDTRQYFFADIKYPVGRGQTTATVTVLDSQSRTATAAITTPQVFDACPTNPVLNVFPESANFRSTEIRAFQITGGPGGAAVPVVAFMDTGVAELVSATPTTVTVRAVSTTTRSTLMTITTADRQQASVVLSVLPQ